MKKSYAKNKKFRVHDKIYLKKKFFVKESDKFILENIIYLKKNFSNFVDIGCANGSFLSLISSFDSKIKTYGADVRSDLLKVAKKHSPKSKFFQIDINKKLTKKQIKKIGKFDAILMGGVHTIFDDIKIWVRNLIDLTNKDGIIFLYGSFNPRDIDVLVKAKDSKNNIWESGWNRWSIKSIFKEFKKYSFFGVAKKFNIKIDIKEDKKDPKKNWTIDTQKEKLTVNGLELISSPYLLILKNEK